MSVQRRITALGEENNSHKERKDRKEGAEPRIDFATENEVTT
jgi:hypothetical protein